MTASSGHLLVGKTMRLLRLAVEKASRIVRDKIPQAAPIESQAEPIYARVTTRPSGNRIAALRQGQSHGYHTHRRIDSTVRQFSSTAQNASKPTRASYPSSRTGQKVTQSTLRAPFASTLRPNLTGGALSRSAGGYGTGAGRINGVRYFSHTPASPAEVIQNVSQAVRAFWLSGQKARFDGYDPRTGEKRFRAMSVLQDKARSKLEMSRVNAAGSFIDFKVSPTITAVGPLASIPRCSSITESTYGLISAEEECTIANTQLLTNLEVDFARALKDLAAIMNDLKHLSTLGSLPLFLIDNTTLRVRFPGCDQDTVENLCRELNVRRGIVGQDADFEEKHGVNMALMFPFAPSETPSESFMHEIVFENENPRPAKKSRRGPIKQQRQPKRELLEWQHMLSPAQSASPAFSVPGSHEMIETADAEIVDNPWLSSPSGYSSLHASDEIQDYNDLGPMFFQPAPHSKQFVTSAAAKSQGHVVAGYEGIEGVYRFLEECDRAQLRR